MKAAMQQVGRLVWRTIWFLHHGVSGLQDTSAVQSIGCAQLGRCSGCPLRRHCTEAEGSNEQD